MKVGRIIGAPVTTCTFMSAADGNLVVVCTPSEKPYENTHVPFERPHAVRLILGCIFCMSTLACDLCVRGRNRAANPSAPTYHLNPA